MVFGEGATVFVDPLDPWPEHGGGPVRREGPQTVRTQPYTGNTVYRSPHQVIKVGEPGAVWPGITEDRFLPDGRLVRQGSLGGVFGGTVQLDAKTALERLSAQYVALRKQLGHINTTYRKLGIKTPCDEMGAFNAAANEYRRLGRIALDAIRKRIPSATFHQIPVDMEGRPLLDAQGRPKLRTIDVPLDPGGFVFGTGSPASTTKLYAPAQLRDGELGAEWTTYALAGLGIAVGVGLFVVAAPAAGLVAAGLYGAGTAALVLGLSQVKKIVWPSNAEEDNARYLVANEARLDCLDRAAARGVKGDAAIAECGKAAPYPKPSGGLGFLGYIGLGTLLVGGTLGAVYVYKRRRSIAERGRAIVARVAPEG